MIIPKLFTKDRGGCVPWWVPLLLLPFWLFNLLTDENGRRKRRR